MVFVFATVSGCKHKSTGFNVTHDYPALESPMPVNDITASELVSNIYVGWNLGNTLDAAHLTWLGKHATVAQLETGWGNPVTTKANIAALKNAGFNAIRIPCSWSKVIDDNYIIRTDWMKRVVEIVNYAIDYDMYVILNTHHDEGIFGFLDSNTEESIKAFRIIWEQIAAVFKNYSEKLIFEGLNEPRTIGSSKEWTGGTPAEHINLNKYYQVFVDTVRASGGNNKKRMLIINPYAASSSLGALSLFKIPNDTVKDKIIVSVHSYAPYNFALNKDMSYNKWDRNNPEDTSPITDGIDRVYDMFVSKNIPVIMGEFGAMNKNNENTRVQWADFYISYAKSKGIPCIWWDNGVVTGDDAERFGLLDRNTNKFAYPELVAAIIKASGAVIGPPVTMPKGDMPVITLPQNQWSPGYQTQYNMNIYLDGEKITEGDEFIFEYSFKSNIAIEKFSLVLVDATEQANWWTELSDWVDLGNIPAGEEVNGKTAFLVIKTATSNAAAANKLVFDAGPETASMPTLTFTNFSIEKK